jgi:hypothetical protein
MPFHQRFDVAPASVPPRCATPPPQSQGTADLNYETSEERGIFENATQLGASQTTVQLTGIHTAYPDELAAAHLQEETGPDAPSVVQWPANSPSTHEHRAMQRLTCSAYSLTGLVPDHASTYATNSELLSLWCQESAQLTHPMELGLFVEEARLPCFSRSANCSLSSVADAGDEVQEVTSRAPAPLSAPKMRLEGKRVAEEVSGTSSSSSSFDEWLARDIGHRLHGHDHGLIAFDVNTAAPGIENPHTECLPTAEYNTWDGINASPFIANNTHDTGYTWEYGAQADTSSTLSGRQDYPTPSFARRCPHPSCSSQVLFIRQCDLDKHYRLHFRKYYCRAPECQMPTSAYYQTGKSSQIGFSTIKDRNRHESRHKPSLTCHYCGKLFSRQDNLRDHCRRLHLGNDRHAD